MCAWLERSTRVLLTQRWLFLARVSGGYHEYFGADVDDDAITYLQLANAFLHEVRAASEAPGVAGTTCVRMEEKEKGKGREGGLGVGG